MEKNLNRRSLLRWGLGGMTAVVASKALAAGETCSKTAAQARGPFYPGEAEIVPINDLTRVAGSQVQALGKLILLEGTVRDQNCELVPDVNVEIWQACASGRYNHPNDPNPAPLDPNFRYWGEDFTDASGRYSFRSIIPGAYPAGDGWVRPPHIHFRIAKRGYKELITQMYFKGESLNDSDLILRAVPQAQRAEVIVDFQNSEDNPDLYVGSFNITIEKILRP